MDLEDGNGCSANSEASSHHVARNGAKQAMGMGEGSTYLVMMAVYLVGAIGGMLVGCHIGESIGKKLGSPIGGIFAGAAAGGTIGILLVYGVSKFVPAFLS